MRDARLTVVISQGQSRSPDKRQLETDVAEAAAALPQVDVLVVPHLYDLARDGETYQRMRTLSGPIVLCAWLFDRAAHWVIDRHGVSGQVGETLLKPDSDVEPEEAADDAAAEVPADRVIDSFPRPDRNIYCLDLRASAQSTAFVGEIARIAELEQSSRWLRGAPELASLPQFATPSNNTYVGHTVTPLLPGPSQGGQNTEPLDNTSLAAPTMLGSAGVVTISEHPARRWYPVIDFSRCTNCMECIDFCLFGVYGIDNVETILVEQPDNCRKGCPACSRVCPQNAIMFPQHKTPAIAGAPMDMGGLKIDLSKLFGAPDDGADAIEVAARERDEQLLLAGRQAVGITEDFATRIGASADAPRDELDSLIDQLDSMEL